MSMQLWRNGPIVVALACLAGRADGQQIPLRAVFDSILKNHPSLKMTDATVRAVAGTRRSAGAFGNPMVSYQVENTPFPGGRVLPGIDREASLTATVPLEPLFQRGPRVQQASAMVRAAEADGASERARLAALASDAYYRVAFAQAASATAHELAGWFDSVVVYTRNRLKEGIVAEVELIRAENERDRALADATMRDADLARARADLTAFLGDPHHVASSFTVITDSTPLTLPGVGAATQRPEVRAARERLAATSGMVSLEQAMTLRQVGATVGLKRMVGTSSMVAGLSLPLPIFDANRGGVQRATAEREAASWALAGIERSAAADLAGALEVARLLTDRATALGAGGVSGFLARAAEARRVTLGAYREGAIPLMQVIDAARAWSDARTTWYQVLFAQHQSILALLTAQGADLLNTLPVTPAAGVPTP